MSTFLQRKWAPPSPSLALRCSGSWGRSCTTMRSSISPTFTSSSSWERRWVHTHKLWFGIHICHRPNVSTWTFCGTDLRNSVRAAGQWTVRWSEQSFHKNWDTGASSLSVLCYKLEIRYFLIHFLVYYHLEWSAATETWVHTTHHRPLQKSDVNKLKCTVTPSTNRVKGSDWFLSNCYFESWPLRRCVVLKKEKKFIKQI